MWCQGRKPGGGQRNRGKKESQAVEDIPIGFLLKSSSTENEK